MPYKLAVNIDCVFHKREFKNVHDTHVLCSILHLSLQPKEVTKLIQEGLEKEEKPKSPKEPALPWCPWTVIQEVIFFQRKRWICQNPGLRNMISEHRDGQRLGMISFVSSMTVGCPDSCLIGPKTQGESSPHLIHSLRLTQPSLLWHFCSTELQKILASPKTAGRGS